jgi:glucose 1-dehydrogenase
MEFEGKVALVTGGAIRLGRAISLALAEAGCDLFIIYGRSAGPAESVKAEVERFGVQAQIYSANLADVEATASIFPAAINRFDRVDILINNAGVFKGGNLAETTLDAWDSLFAINLRAPFQLSQAFAAQIGDEDQGAIISISDARVFRPAADHFAYRLTKSALITMTETLAHDLAPRITVNAIAPGAILPPPDQDKQYLENMARTSVPLGRPGNSKMVADSVLYLLKQDFLTGVTIKIDGGQFL